MIEQVKQFHEIVEKNFDKKILDHELNQLFKDSFSKSSEFMVQIISSFQNETPLKEKKLLLFSKYLADVTNFAVKEENIDTIRKSWVLTSEKIKQFVETKTSLAFPCILQLIQMVVNHPIMAKDLRNTLTQIFPSSFENEHLLFIENEFPSEYILCLNAFSSAYKNPNELEDAVKKCLHFSSGNKFGWMNQEGLIRLAFALNFHSFLEKIIEQDKENQLNQNLLRLSFFYENQTIAASLLKRANLSLHHPIWEKFDFLDSLLLAFFKEAYPELKAEYLFSSTLPKENQINSILRCLDQDIVMTFASIESFVSAACQVSEKDLQIEETRRYLFRLNLIFSALQKKNISLNPFVNTSLQPKWETACQSFLTIQKIQKT